ncbi:MAG TPA: hypothetical protein PLB25_16830 [Rhodoferax sp.]|nr:hypothetical protein [Rhodoferax sp.]
MNRRSGQAQQAQLAVVAAAGLTLGNWVLARLAVASMLLGELRAIADPPESPASPWPGHYDAAWRTDHHCLPVFAVGFVGA